MDPVKLEISNHYETLDEFVRELITIVAELCNRELLNCSYLAQLLDESDPAFSNFEELASTGISSIRKLSEAFERTLNTADEDDSEIKAEFWQFLMNQLMVRANTLRECSIARGERGSGDCNSSLSDQTWQLNDLAKLIDQCDGWGRSAVSIEVNSTNAGSVQSDALPSIVA